MTEASWRRCDDPKKLLSFLRSVTELSERKRLLLACACCRAFWRRLADDRSRRAVEELERVAEGRSSLPYGQVARAMVEVKSLLLGRLHLQPGRGSLPYVTWGSLVRPGTRLCALDAMSVLNEISADSPGVVVEVCAEEGRVVEYGTPLFRLIPTLSAEGVGDLAKRRAAVVRDSFRYPGREGPPPGAFPADVRSVAQAAYTRGARHTGELDNLRLGVLADALEESGCSDGALLAHLRSPGPHVRGCWALDLVLGKD